MWAASLRAKQTELKRQRAALTDEELALYDCLKRARLDNINRDFYRVGYIEGSARAAGLAAPPARDAHYLLIRGSLRKFWA
jgi:hypothetical protein